MCGIAGIILSSDRTLPDLQERLLAMREAMTHRGPDDAGSCVSPDGREPGELPPGNPRSSALYGVRRTSMASPLGRAVNLYGDGHAVVGLRL